MQNFKVYFNSCEGVQMDNVLFVQENGFSNESFNTDVNQCNQ